MRISTQQMYMQGVGNIVDKQSNLATLQSQIGSGKRLLTPADDPVAAAHVVTISNAQSQIGQYQKNINMVTQRLGQEDTTLSSATNSIQRIRELVVQANGLGLSNSDRASIASEVSQRLSELVGYGNTVDGNGDYLFAGNQASAMPFTMDAAGNVTYNGDQGNRQVAISATRSVADSNSGDAVFMSIRNGNGMFATAAAGVNTGTGTINAGSVTNAAAYVPDNFQINFTSATTFDVVDTTSGATVLSAQPYTADSSISFNGSTISISGQPASGDSFTVQPSSNQSVFKTVNDFVNALNTPVSTPADRARFNNAASTALTNIDQAMQNFLSVRASVGAREQTIQAQQQSNDDFNTQLTQLRSSLESTDMVKAVSDLSLQMTTLQAGEQAFVKVQGLSLFNYFR